MDFAGPMGVDSLRWGVSAAGGSVGRTEIRVGGPAISKRELIYMLLSKGGQNWQRLFLCEDFVFSRNQGRMQSEPLV